jgi:DNA-binding transcriptional ArsR family regulator
MKPAAASLSREVECITEAQRAAVLLHPLRLEIVARAREATSASEIADRLGLPRQRVNYHVRELARAGLLRRAGTRRKRNLLEQLYVATAESYLLAPEVLGPAGPRLDSSADTMSAAHLLALTARTQSEVARALRQAADAGQALSTLTLATELRFESAAQRARFAEELQQAMAAVVARSSAPYRAADGTPGEGTAFRLVLSCHPIPENGERDTP